MSKNQHEINHELSIIPDDTIEFSGFTKEKDGKSKLLNNLNLTSDRFMSKCVP